MRVEITRRQILTLIRAYRPSDIVLHPLTLYGHWDGDMNGPIWRWENDAGFDSLSDEQLWDFYQCLVARKYEKEPDACDEPIEFAPYKMPLLRREFPSFEPFYKTVSKKGGFKKR